MLSEVVRFTATASHLTVESVRYTAKLRGACGVAAVKTL